VQSTGTIGEIKQRGMAAIEDGLRHAPVHIIKRKKSAAVVLSEAQYQSLAGGHQPTCLGESQHYSGC